MLFLYFSGTGNTRFCIEYLGKSIDESAPVYSIEQPEALEAIRQNEEIIIGYPVYYSNLPKILRDFINENKALWRGKKILVVATMGLFSGDGAGVLARLLKKQGAGVIGGLHLQMPDCILDVKALKRTPEQNREIVNKAIRKMDQAVEDWKQGRLPREGLHIWNHVAGLFGQRCYFFSKTKDYTDKLRIDAAKCIGCGKCVSLCPMQNIVINCGTAQARDKCTMCYRCISNCPEQAITLLGKKIVGQAVTLS